MAGELTAQAKAPRVHGGVEVGIRAIRLPFSSQKQLDKQCS